jgi:hypothetical protein
VAPLVYPAWELQREVSAGERIVLDFMARAGIEPVDAVM